MSIAKRGELREEPWTETVSPNGASVAIVVDAVDVARTERNEVEAFRRALTAPDRERGVQIRDRHGNMVNSRDFLRAIGGISYILGVVLAAALFEGLFPGVLYRLGGTFVMIAFGLVLLAPVVFAVVRHFYSRPRTSAAIRDRFTLSLDASGFALTGAATEHRSPLDSIERFEDDGRLVLVASDGRGRASRCRSGSVARTRPSLSASTTRCARCAPTPVTAASFRPTPRRRQTTSRRTRALESNDDCSKQHRQGAAALPGAGVLVSWCPPKPDRRPHTLRSGHVRAAMLVLRQDEERGRQADRWAFGEHLQRMHRSLCRRLGRRRRHARDDRGTAARPIS